MTAYTRPINLLIVRDRHPDPEPLGLELRRAGFHLNWLWVETRGDYLQALRQSDPGTDVVLVDQELESFSPDEALDLLRASRKDLPFIVLGTPSNGEAENFLRRGATDYINESGLIRLGPAIQRAVSEKRLKADLKAANSQLLHTYKNILYAWTRALELRDFETHEHTRRVRTLTLRLAREIGLRGEVLVHIGRGAMLHDVGKLGIPDHILLKPGPLTPEERRIMEQHPVIACQMLQPIEFLHPALEIPRSHHEKWDGTGYPYGLAGEEIPLTARIFAVVDVWDALNSARPYRPDPWPREKIVEYMRSESGRHFDPSVVRTFMNLTRADGLLQ